MRAEGANAVSVVARIPRLEPAAPQRDLCIEEFLAHNTVDPHAAAQLRALPLKFLATGAGARLPDGRRKPNRGDAQQDPTCGEACKACWATGS